jgi:hypothetical protein
MSITDTVLRLLPRPSLSSKLADFMALYIGAGETMGAAIKMLKLTLQVSLRPCCRPHCKVGASPLVG